jgi:hypothetical protein
MDLSMHALAREYRGGFLQRATNELLIDHSSETARRLLAARRADLILDNAGPELVCDLLLAARLLAEPAGTDGPRQMVLHAKRSPFFVSDARPADVRATIQALAGSATREVGAAGSLLADGLSEGRLRIRDHWFWNGPRFFQDLPADLRSQLAACDLVVIKGDANYRPPGRGPPLARLHPAGEAHRLFPRPLRGAAHHEKRDRGGPERGPGPAAGRRGSRVAHKRTARNRALTAINGRA